MYWRVVICRRVLFGLNADVQIELRRYVDMQADSDGLVRIEVGHDSSKFVELEREWELSSYFQSLEIK